MKGRKQEIFLFSIMIYCISKSGIVQCGKRQQPGMNKVSKFVTSSPEKSFLKTQINKSHGYIKSKCTEFSPHLVWTITFLYVPSLFEPEQISVCAKGPGKSTLQELCVIKSSLRHHFYELSACFLVCDYMYLFLLGISLVVLARSYYPSDRFLEDIGCFMEILNGR